jgi:hypothetical protein
MNGRLRASAKAKPPPRTLGDRQCIRAVGPGAPSTRSYLENFARFDHSSLVLAEAKSDH